MAYTFPASYGQQALWLLIQLAPDEGRYQLGFKLTAPTAADPAELAAALATVVERHETLRTGLELRDGELTQVVSETVPVEPQHTDLSHADATTRPEALREVVAADTAAPIPLDTAPLWRARTCRLDDRHCLLIFTGSHTILDATSMVVLAAEVREVIAARAAGHPARLPELAIQYGDFAAWQRDEVAAGRLEPHLAYWRTQLAGLPEHHRLPADRPRPRAMSSAGGQLTFPLRPETVRELRQVARAGGTTPFAVLLAALAALVGRLSGDDDVAIGTPVSGRDLPELGPLIGLLINTLVMRIDLSGDPTFAELLARTRDVVFSALDHQVVPFDLLVGELAPRRTASWNPLYQIGLNLLSSRGLFDGAGVTFEDSGSDEPEDVPARFDLHLDMYELPEGMLGALEYARDLFDDATAATFARRYAGLVAAAVADPDRRLSTLPLLAGAEREAVLAAARPALEDPPALDLGPPAVLADGDLVAIELPPEDPGWADALRAVLAAGRAVLPLPAGLPPARRAFLLRDAAPTAVLTTPPPADPASAGPAAAGTVAAGTGVVGTAGAGSVVAYPAGAGLPRGVVLTAAALAARVANVRAAAPPGRWSVPPADPDGIVLLLAASADGDDVPLTRPAPPPGWGCAVAVGDALLVGWPETGPAFRHRDGAAWPLPCTGALVVAADGVPVPDGVEGELLVGGPVVAGGYLNRPGPTALRFVGYPPGGRAFAPGVRARRLPGGGIVLADEG
jgi:non-ribosomal peptide synthetase component F